MPSEVVSIRIHVQECVISYGFCVVCKGGPVLTVGLYMYWVLNQGLNSTDLHYLAELKEKIQDIANFVSCGASASSF